MRCKRLRPGNSATYVRCTAAVRVRRKKKRTDRAYRPAAPTSTKIMVPSIDRSWCSAMQLSAVLCSAVQCSTSQYSTAVQCNTVQ